MKDLVALCDRCHELTHEMDGTAKHLTMETVPDVLKKRFEKAPKFQKKRKYILERSGSFILQSGKLLYCPRI